MSVKKSVNITGLEAARASLMLYNLVQVWLPDKKGCSSWPTKVILLSYSLSAPHQQGYPYGNMQSVLRGRPFAIWKVPDLNVPASSKSLACCYKLSLRATDVFHCMCSVKTHQAHGIVKQHIKTIVHECRLIQFSSLCS